MRARTAALAALALPLLLLAGCGVVSTPTPSPSPSESSSPTPDAQPLDLPDDAVVAVTGVATAENGATADVLVVVHAPAAFDSPEASEAVTATIDWCEGEVDADVIASQTFSFVTVDIAITATSGDWPSDAQLLVLPMSRTYPVGSTLAVSPGLHQVEITSGGEGDYVPHCLQPAFLDGAGAGSLYLGVPVDGSGWLAHQFGVSATLPGDLGTTPVTFSDCAITITDLAAEFGAPGADWQQTFENDVCAVGAPE